MIPKLQRHTRYERQNVISLWHGAKSKLLRKSLTMI